MVGVDEFEIISLKTQYHVDDCNDINAIPNGEFVFENKNKKQVDDKSKKKNANNHPH